MAPQTTLQIPNYDASCLTCSIQCKDASLKCFTCKHFTHINCSNLPAYMLLTYKFGSSRYFCQSCLRKKHECYDDEIEQLTKLISIHEYNEHNPSSVVAGENHPESAQIQNTQQDKQYVTTPNDNQSVIFESTVSAIDELSNYVALPTTFHNHEDENFRRNYRQNSLPFSTPRTGQTPRNNLRPSSSLEYDYDSTILLQNRFDSLGNINEMNEFPPLPTRPATEKLPDITELKPESNEQRTTQHDSLSSSSDLSTITSAQRSPPKLSIKPQYQLQQQNIRMLVNSFSQTNAGTVKAAKDVIILTPLATETP